MTRTPHGAGHGHSPRSRFARGAAPDDPGPGIVVVCRAAAFAGAGAQRRIKRSRRSDTFDLDAIVKLTDGDPARIFAWVRDKTFWVPYRGELRGAAGVLMDRLGNSLDRALLLAELLRRAGQDVRLAHAQLSDEQAR